MDSIPAVAVDMIRLLSKMNGVMSCGCPDPGEEGYVLGRVCNMCSNKRRRQVRHRCDAYKHGGSRRRKE